MRWGTRWKPQRETLRDLRVAEVVKLDVKVENGKVSAYRVRLQLSFKYEG
jgi:flavin-binding protein dodecin